MFFPKRVSSGPAAEHLVKIFCKRCGAAELSALIARLRGFFLRWWFARLSSGVFTHALSVCIAPLQIAHSSYSTQHAWGNGTLLVPHRNPCYPDLAFFWFGYNVQYSTPPYSRVQALHVLGWELRVRRRFSIRCVLLCLVPCSERVADVTLMHDVAGRAIHIDELWLGGYAG